MKNRFLTAFLCLILNSMFSQDKFTISGYITDAQNGENIVGVNIYCKDLNLGVTSNTYGFYSLTLPEGKYDISYSFIGYQTEIKNFQLKNSVKHDIEFQLSAINIQEVLVTAEKNIVEKTQTSMIEVPIEPFSMLIYSFKY